MPTANTAAVQAAHQTSHRSGGDVPAKNGLTVNMRACVPAARVLRWERPGCRSDRTPSDWASK